MGIHQKCRKRLIILNIDGRKLIILNIDKKWPEIQDIDRKMQMGGGCTIRMVMGKTGS